MPENEELFAGSGAFYGSGTGEWNQEPGTLPWISAGHGWRGSRGSGRSCTCGPTCRGTSGKKSGCDTINFTFLPANFYEMDSLISPVCDTCTYRFYLLTSMSMRSRAR